ncbi:MAG: CPBP family intramembrane metalloprotease [Ruminococcus sp.]|nr:CPBP family intramembrane metalloprotease [Ruminococcus sp.]
MNEEYYRAEISSLNCEIRRLNRQIETERQKEMPDKLNPFDNPTDYPDFSGDYSDIMPKLDAPDCIVPLDPAPEEHRKIKRFYSIGGWCIMGHFFLSSILTWIAMLVLEMVLKFQNSGAGENLINSYMKSSSILAGLNMLVFMLSNVLFAFIGLKMADIPKTQLVRTREFSFGKSLQYCLIAAFLWTISIFASAWIENIFSHYGYSTDVMDMDGLAVTGTGFAVMMIYQCVIAPITEEIFFRGMLLRVFSRANQRFAVFATAFFFGLGHHNIPQFVLAFILGIFLSHITLKHNSVIPSIIVHIFVNTMSGVISYVESYFGLNGTIVAECVILVMAILGFFLLCLFRGKDKIPSSTPAQSRRGVAIAKKSVIFVSAVLLQLIYTVALIFM